MSTGCLVTEDAIVPAVVCAFVAILLVPPALRVLASLRGRGDRTTTTQPRKAGEAASQRDDGSRLHPITSFGAWGRADGCLNSPRFLLPVEGGVLVADSGNDRLQIFTADGAHVRTIQGSRPGQPTTLILTLTLNLTLTLTQPLTLTQTLTLTLTRPPDRPGDGRDARVGGG